MNERLHFKEGAIGGLLGVNGGAGGTGFGGPSAGVADPTGNNNLQATYTQLGNIANGQGPNPAMAQYNQNIQNVAKQQAGAISSVQGISPALAARLASQQGSAAMQNAAAQGATMQSEQQLGALGQMGGIAGNQANIAAGLQQNVNNVNSGLAQTTMQGQQGMVGNLFNAVGVGGKTAMGGASGGMVGKDFAKPMAEGGSVGPQSQFTQFLQSRAGAPAPVMVEPSQNVAPVSGMGAGMGGNLQKKSGIGPAGAPVTQNTGQGPTMAAAGQPVSGIPYSEPDIAQKYGLGFGAAPAMARGGTVPALLSPGETYIPPERLGKAANSKNPLKEGKKIPGTPKVPGNSYANDVVPAKLKEGGVVIPNNIMQSKDPAQGAKDFIAAIISKRKASK